MTAASVLPFPTPELHGSATTAAGREESALGAMTPEITGALEARGLDVELMAKLGVGASPKLGGVSIGIPYHADELRVGCKHRTLAGEKRFAQDVGSAQVFYNQDCLADETLADMPLIITEGEIDCWSALQSGYPRTVSVPGGAPSKPVAGEGRKYSFLDHPALANVKKIILAVDDDEPGANLREDLAMRLGTYRCHFVKYPRECKDLNDALRLFGERGVTASIVRAQPLAINGYYEIDELPPSATARAYDTGIIGLGEHYKLRLGDLCVITGIPGHGKSSFINEICCRMTQNHGWKTVFASFEQKPDTDHRRALRSFYAEKLEKMMSPSEKERADAWIREHFGFIVPGQDDNVTLAWMLRVMEQAILRKEAQIMVIDPWNEMDHTRPPDMTQTEYVGFAIKEFKRFARKYNIHLIIAAHPAKMARNKDGKWPMPELYDISDSAHWANKPDVGIVVHREKMIGSETTINVLKTRYADIGRPGTIKGNWNIERTRYTITE